jgi:hypothetical protein
VVRHARAKSAMTGASRCRTDHVARSGVVRVSRAEPMRRLPTTTSLAGIPVLLGCPQSLRRRHVACAAPVSVSKRSQPTRGLILCLSIYRCPQVPVLAPSIALGLSKIGRTYRAELAMGVAGSRRETSCGDVGCVTRNVEGPPGLPGRPFSTT